VRDQRRRLALLFAAMPMIMTGYGIFIPVMPFVPHCKSLCDHRMD
jgi:hypothetical protein